MKHPPEFWRVDKGGQDRASIMNIFFRIIFEVRFDMKLRRTRVAVARALFCVHARSLILSLQYTIYEETIFGANLFFRVFGMKHPLFLQYHCAHMAVATLTKFSDF
jgi:hypothetical protein